MEYIVRRHTITCSIVVYYKPKLEYIVRRHTITYSIVIYDYRNFLPEKRLYIGLIKCLFIEVLSFTYMNNYIIYYSWTQKKIKSIIPYYKSKLENIVGRYSTWINISFIYMINKHIKQSILNNISFIHTNVIRHCRHVAPQAPCWIGNSAPGTHNHSLHPAAADWALNLLAESEGVFMEQFSSS